MEYYYHRRYKPVDISPPLSPLIVPNVVPSIVTTATTANHAVDPTSPTERTPLIDRKPQPRSKTPSPSPSGSVVSMIASPLSFASRSPRTPLFLAGSYASISGILSGMCLIFAKSGVELLLLTLGGDNQFWRWQSWVLLLSLIVFALLQLWYMHKGLVLADPTLVCPCEYIHPIYSHCHSAPHSGILLLQLVINRERPGIFRPVLDVVYHTPPACSAWYRRTPRRSLCHQLPT